jgi:hypothetical protein
MVKILLLSMTLTPELDGTPLSSADQIEWHFRPTLKKLKGLITP